MENGVNAENKELYRLFLDRLGTTTTLTGNMKPLKALLPLDYAQTERLILHVGLQMQVLLEEQQGICGFTLDDITVLEGEYYLLTGLEQVVSVKNINKKKEPLFTYTYPLKFSEAAKELLAPELREKLAAKVLPFTTSLSVGYYSLAKLCLECLGLTDNLEALRGSKMYYCFERCLRVEPAERAFLYF
jgi:hypothetical protein